MDADSTLPLSLDRQLSFIWSSLAKIYTHDARFVPGGSARYDGSIRAGRSCHPLASESSSACQASRRYLNGLFPMAFAVLG